MRSRYREGLSLEQKGDLEGAFSIFTEVSEHSSDEELKRYAQVKADNIRASMEAAPFDFDESDSEQESEQDQPPAWAPESANKVAAIFAICYVIFIWTASVAAHYLQLDLSAASINVPTIILTSFICSEVFKRLEGRSISKRERFRISLGAAVGYSLSMLLAIVFGILPAPVQDLGAIYWGTAIWEMTMYTGGAYLFLAPAARKKKPKISSQT